MQATYRLSVNELNEDFITTIKKIYKDKEIEIIIQEAEDETEYLMRSPANREHLLRAIEEDKQGKYFNAFEIEELELMVNENNISK